MSKNKGSQWERDVAKYLTEWLTGQRKQYYFWRSPGSGSIATISEENIGLHGDIVHLKNEAKFLCSIFVIECKNGYPKTTLDNHLKYNKSDNIKDFWTQTLESSKKSNKYPMLIYKKRGFKAPWVGINKKCKERFENYINNIRYAHLGWGEENLDDLYFFSFYEFFDLIKPPDIKEIFNCID